MTVPLLLSYRDFPILHLRREPLCSSETTPQAKAFFSSSDQIVIAPIPFFFFSPEVHKACQSLVYKMSEALAVLIA